MNIKIKTIPHNKQDYNTVGNWKLNDCNLTEILVSDMKNDDYAFLISIHEFIEAWLCIKRGIDEKKITAFDKAFEKKRKKGSRAEPGNDAKSPYRREHRFATKIERMVCKEMGIKWDVYNRTVEGL